MLLSESRQPVPAVRVPYRPSVSLLSASSQRDWLSLELLLYFSGFWLYYTRQRRSCLFAECTTNEAYFCTKNPKNWDTSTAPKCGAEHGRRDQRCLPHGAVLADVLLRPAEPCHLPPAVPPGRKAVNGYIKSVLQLYKIRITAAFGGAASQPVCLYKFDIPDIQIVNNVPILPRF